MCQKVCGSTMKDRSDDPSHHEQVFLNGAGVCQKVCGILLRLRTGDELVRNTCLPVDKHAVGIRPGDYSDVVSFSACLTRAASNEFHVRTAHR